ncbi:molybdate ABC transporter substrate-binding protein [Ectothiorhodospiraceae bacterium 2226]|nr:molybdate ABC transporter substrate-binding protein [Ectothiorhodospiraceae bacterium 2226]
MRRSLVPLALLFLLCAPITAAAADLRIAAAADLKYAMDEIVARFAEAHPEAKVEVIYGSSGRFRAQVAHGAPFDLYFSADIEYPRSLARDGHAASEVIPYAVGRIVLWSTRLDAAGLALADLAKPEIRRVAIANPRHAPYGKRAQEALEAAGVWDAVRPKLVFGENIAHAAQFVESGAAEVGIIALALAINPHLREQGAYRLIDDDLHGPLEQGFIVTRRAADNPLAFAFAAFLSEPPARAIMARYGFMAPDA